MLEMPKLGRVPRRWSLRKDGLADRRYKLDSAILIYAAVPHREALFNDERAGDNMYATLHQIERRRVGGPHLAAGVPATAEACGEFAKAISLRAAFSGFMSPQLLYVGPQVVAWWRAPAPARVWFDSSVEAAGDQTAVKIGKRSGITPHPGVVFLLAQGTWYVYAVKGAERPGPESALFMAPYFNVWTNGQICEGNVKRPGRVNAETMQDFERAFFDSRFTHPNVKKLVNHPGGAGAFWTALLDGRWKTFPERCLLPKKRTIEQRLKQLEAGHHGE